MRCPGTFNTTRNTFTRPMYARWANKPKPSSLSQDLIACIESCVQNTRLQGRKVDLTWLGWLLWKGNLLSTIFMRWQMSFNSQGTYVSHLKSNLNKLILHGNANCFLGFASLHILASYYQPMIERYILEESVSGTGVQWYKITWFFRCWNACINHWTKW